MIDGWTAATEAMEERSGGLPARPMLTRWEAVATADAYLRESGSTDRVLGATPNPLQGFWVVDTGPADSAERIDGGSSLVVPTEGEVREGLSGPPPWAESIGLEESELSRWEAGEDLLGGGWDNVLRGELDAPYLSELLEFLSRERRVADVFPAPSQTFRAFELTPYDNVKVVILGQDPYPNPGEAEGLAFSVPSGVRMPPSLRNILKLLEADLSRDAPVDVDRANGSLASWAEEGVLLLNTALTVRAGSPRDRASHRRWRYDGKGWSTFTDAVIRAVNAKTERVVFLLWGKDAKAKADLVDQPRHVVIAASHPSPFSARLSFLAAEHRPFSSANAALQNAHRDGVRWV